MDREFNRRRYDDEDEGTYVPRLVFVMMSFVAQGADAAYTAIKSACDELHLNAVRIDDAHAGSGFIIRDVIEMIEAAEFLVCDLTDERPNVYYELGYAHGVGNEADDILLVARIGTKLHFDIAPLRVRYYVDHPELYEIVKEQMSIMRGPTHR